MTVIGCFSGTTLRAALATAILSLFACGADAPPEDVSEDFYVAYQSSKTRELVPNITDEAFAQLVESNNQFALNLWQQLRAGNEDLLFSPISISTSLAMAFAGAGSSTHSEMAQALQFDLPEPNLHAGFNRLTATMQAREEAASELYPALELNIVNAVFPKMGQMPAQSFMDTLAVNYGEGVYALDYVNAPEQSRQKVNSMVAEWTRGLIPELLPENTVKKSTEIILSNTIYLKAPWSEPFDSAAEMNGNFTDLNGNLHKVKKMRGEMNFAFMRQSEQADVLILPFHEQQLEMAFILPAMGSYPDFVSELKEVDQLEELLAFANRTRVMAMVPRFSQEYSQSLVDPLKALGMQEAFTSLADFTPMGLSHNLKITAVSHSAKLVVNESGVEAAASTAVVGGAESVPPTFSVDRPFVYLIRDRPTGVILFMGAVTSPQILEPAGE